LSPHWERIGERERGATAGPGPPAPSSFLGNVILMRSCGRRRYGTTKLRGRDTGVALSAGARPARAGATAAHARSPAATPDGRRSYKTADRDSVWWARSAPHSRDGRSEKIGNPPLRAGPRSPCPQARPRHPVPHDGPRRLRRHADARRSDTGIADTGPGVSPGRCPSVGTGGWLVFVANAALPHGTRRHSTGPGDGSVGRASHTP
jgi:hypothetical protein